MCLATAYKTQATEGNLLMRNLQRIECRDGQVFLTDLMDRQVVIEGELVMADLVENVVIVRERG